MAYSENVVKFFELYDNDPELQKRLTELELAYPGSLEIREYVVEDVLLPVAKEMGLEFSLYDLRKYETAMKLRRGLDVPVNPDEPDTEYKYWLLDRGWTNDDSIFEPDGVNGNGGSMT